MPPLLAVLAAGYSVLCSSPFTPPGAAKTCTLYGTWEGKASSTAESVAHTCEVVHTVDTLLVALEGEVGHGLAQAPHLYMTSTACTPGLALSGLAETARCNAHPKCPSLLSWDTWPLLCPTRQSLVQGLPLFTDTPAA